jgi:hypothetical protein
MASCDSINLKLDLPRTCLRAAEHSLQSIVPGDVHTLDLQDRDGNQRDRLAFSSHRATFQRPFDKTMNQVQLKNSLRVSPSSR